MTILIERFQRPAMVLRAKFEGLDLLQRIECLESVVGIVGTDLQVCTRLKFPGDEAQEGCLEQSTASMAGLGPGIRKQDEPASEASVRENGIDGVEGICVDQSQICTAAESLRLPKRQLELLAAVLDTDVEIFRMLDRPLQEVSILTGSNLKPQVSLTLEQLVPATRFLQLL